jgi:hypothetical protein
MFGIRHKSHTPDVKELCAILQHHQVSYVVGGSVAAAILGVQILPGDLDVIPEVTRENLSRLAIALEQMEARPHGPFGQWTTSATGEYKWLPRPTTEQELDHWRPNPEDLSSFDHLFTTKHGNFDVVPEIAGSFELLNPKATMHEVFGIKVRVSHVDDLLARLTVARREKDINRVASLRLLQRDYGKPQ